jgi:branched-chain amino acid transport system permease protein
MLVMVFVGGAGTLWGPVVGATSLYILEEISRSVIQQGFYILPALLLIMVFIFMPKGIVGVLRERTLPLKSLRLINGLKAK